MAFPLASTAEEDEIALYPIHEEEHVPQGGFHYLQHHYLVGALRARRPDLWTIGDICLYWEEGNSRKYVAADIEVMDGPEPQPVPTVWLEWRHPPLLFVAEIASPSTGKRDSTEKVQIFEREIGVPEYLYVNAMSGEVVLRRMLDGSYRIIPHDEDGRVWSATLELFFGFDGQGKFRAWEPDGTMLLTQEEEFQRANAESRRAKRAETERDALAEEIERLRKLLGE